MTNIIAKENMIKQQLHCCSILDNKILTLYEQFPRESFVPENQQGLAYADLQIDIGHGQVMMSPMVEAKMLQALMIQPDNKILEIGTGTGFITTLLAHLGQHVYSVEIIEDFIEHARLNCAKHQVNNITLQHGNGAQGWDRQQPYDVICITGAIPEITDTLRQQLKVGGRLFAIIGKTPVMEACLITRHTESQWQEKCLFETTIPLLLDNTKKSQFKF